MIYLFDAPVWAWDARATDTWTFVSLPAEESAEIREFAAGVPRGFGSVRVTATIGATTWRTSIFPSKEGVYVLPLKKAVRKAEGLGIDDVVTVKVELGS
ncbi:DUF1905 domain-containing protein [Pseudolysinimonas sp.]|uniref:DUF1905 domain-containing protein n=1 Tax=Pseudolysinimonas sp. TaxID=2680009 RepID=UPI0037841CB0